jgi:uncharacterized membrane protein YjjB (DUF3815 family)
VSPIDRDLLVARVLLALAALGIVVGVVRRELLWIGFFAILALVVQHVVRHRGSR